MQNIEKLLETGHTIKIKPQGWSMYPLIVYGRDSVIIEPLDTDRLKRGDVVLYRRKTGMFVLHRIYRITSDGIFLVGDNQTEIEGPLEFSQVKGKMTAVVRKGKTVTTKNLIYVIYRCIWLRLLPLRPVIGKMIHKIKR